MGSGKHLGYAKNKYGIENFKKEILQLVGNEKEMFELESNIVNDEFVKRKDTYNLKVGGCGGFDYLNNPELFDNPSHSKEHMKMMSKLGVPKSIIKCKWLRENNKDWEKNRIDKYSKTMKEYYKTHSGTFTGKSHTEETKRKMSEKAKIHSKGVRNSQYGTCWIYSLTEKISKKIQKADLQKNLDAGWYKGRKMSFN